MKTKTKKLRAQELMNELDQLSESYDEVALCTSYGLIYPWQWYKLSNLEISLERGGEVHGFICLRRDEDYKLHSTVWPMDDIDRVLDTTILLHSVATVWDIWEDEQQEELVEEMWNPPLQRPENLTRELLTSGAHSNWRI
jgi:hypothetical protein